MFNLVQLRSFIAVAEELSFSKAAQRLYVTQPALSSQVKSLEEFVGKALFIRTQRGLHLTNAGTLLLQQGRRLLTHAERVRELIQQTGTDSGNITIGVGANLAAMLHSLGIEYFEQFPRINLVFREIYSAYQCEALRNCEIDVGFLRSVFVPSSDIVSAPLFTQPLFVVLPATHPFATCTSVKLSQLRDETFFLIPRNEGKVWHDKVIGLFRNAGIKPRIVHTSVSPQFIVSMQVAAGKGLYIQNPTLTQLNSDVVAVKLNEPGASVEIHIVWRKREQSPYVLRLIAMAQNLLTRTFGEPEPRADRSLEESR